jgi:hypothetical protein
LEKITNFHATPVNLICQHNIFAGIGRLKQHSSSPAGSTLNFPAHALFAGNAPDLSVTRDFSQRWQDNG